MKARLAVAVAAAAALVSIAAAQASAEQGGQHISDLRDATERYRSLATAEADGFGIVNDTAQISCIEATGAGGMGTHYLLFPRLFDGEIDLLEPELLLYDRTVTPARLMGVEYVVPAADWHAGHGKQPPKLFGKKFTLVPAGNRYGLPAFYEQHVWLGADNPAGLLKDYNPDVSC